MHTLAAGFCGNAIDAEGSRRNKSTKALQQTAFKGLVELNHTKPYQSRPNRSVRLSHVRRTEGVQTPNSPACSHRRQLRQVFCALFPACSVLCAQVTHLGCVDSVDNVWEHDTPLTVLAGHTCFTKHLIEARCNIDLRDKNGFTPLFSSVIHASVTKQLIEAHCNVDLQEGHPRPNSHGIVITHSLMKSIFLLYQRGDPGVPRALSSLQ